MKLASFGVVIAALVFAVASRWRYEASAGDQTTAAVKKTKVQRSSQTERRFHGEGATDSIPIDTGELRREALELLDGLEEFGKNIDQVERQARLSAIFRKWGRADFEEAKRFLETERVAQKLLSPDRSFADELLLAALIGYSDKDPAQAWDNFLTTQNYSPDRPLLLSSNKPYSHNVAAEEIMRALFRKSAKTALETLREIDPEYRFLVAPGLRGIMAESVDGQLRLELLREYLESPPYGSQTDAEIVLAGLAENDPKFAWEYLQQWSKTQNLISNAHPELYFGRELVEYWSRRQPEQALRFVASMEKGEAQSVFLLGFLSSQDLFRPELVVEALEMESLKDFQELFRPDVFVLALTKDTPWPLIEENVPVPRNERFERLQEAVESSGLSKKLKDDFLTAIKAAKLN